MPLSGVLKITPRFHGHLKVSLKTLSGVIKLTLPIEAHVIHVPLSGRYVAHHLMCLDKENILKPTPGLYLIAIKSYKQKRTLTS